MNLFEMARKAMINDWIERTPPHVQINAQIDVVREQAESLARQTRQLRRVAEELAQRVCCNGQCRQGRDCPLRR